jgi:hypothetical protein
MMIIPDRQPIQARKEYSVLLQVCIAPSMLAALEERRKCAEIATIGAYVRTLLRHQIFDRPSDQHLDSPIGTGSPQRIVGDVPE